MPVPLPFSPAYLGLLLALPGVWLLAREITREVSRDRGLRAVLPFGVALALWLLAVHVASLLAHSLRTGLPAGTIALAIAGVVAAAGRRRQPAREPSTGRSPSPWMWITAIAATAAIAPMALRFFFHDELLTTGHMSIPAEMQNGIYPPRHLTFPDTPLRYHYGFDLLTACLTALLRLQIDVAIDVATLLLWGLSWCLLWVLGERLVGRRRAWLTPFVTLFACGLPVGCPPPGSSINPSMLPNLLTECRIGAFVVNAPTVSYFFQHPWGLGIPVAVTALLVFTEQSPLRERGRYALLAALFVTLSLSEVALFATLLPSMVVADALREDRIAPRRLAAMLVVSAAALGGAKLAGGFLVSVPGLSPLRFMLHAGFADTWRDTLTWNARTFGVFWILGPLGLIMLRRHRVLFGLVVLGSIALVNGVRYEGSDDVMKFATVALIVLGIPGSAALARLLSTARGALARPAIAAALLVGATAGGCLYALGYALDVTDLPAGRRTKPELLSRDDVDAAVFLRLRAAPGDLVYRFGKPSTGYAVWAGLPQPWTDWTASAFGFPRARIAAREQLLGTPSPEVARYRAEGFRFLVLDEKAVEDKQLLALARAWISTGGARIVARFGGLLVFELVAPAR